MQIINIEHQVIAAGLRDWRFLVPLVKTRAFGITG
jgi:hypothetical protein